MSRIAHDRGDSARAENLAIQALELFQRVQDEHGIARAEETLGTIDVTRGWWEAAEGHFARALSIQQARRDLPCIAECLEGFAAVQIGLGDLDRAALTLEQAAQLRVQSECPLPPIDQPAIDRLLQATKMLRVGP